MKTIRGHSEVRQFDQRNCQLSPHTTQVLGTSRGLAFPNSPLPPGASGWPLQIFLLAPSVLGHTYSASALLCILGIETLLMGAKVQALSSLFLALGLHQGVLRLLRQVRERSGISG